MSVSAHLIRQRVAASLRSALASSWREASHFDLDAAPRGQYRYFSVRIPSTEATDARRVRPAEDQVACVSTVIVDFLWVLEQGDRLGSEDAAMAEEANVQAAAMAAVATGTTRPQFVGTEREIDLEGRVFRSRSTFRVSHYIALPVA